MPDLTPSPFRSQANGVINFMAGVGGIFAAFGGAALGPKNPAYPFWMGSVLVILAMVLLFTFIKEPKIAEANEVEVSEVQPGLLESLKTVFQERNKSALFLLLAIFFWTLSYAAISTFFTSYATEHLGVDEEYAKRLFGQFIFSFVVFALLSGYLGSKLGRRATIVMGLVLLGSLILAIFSIPAATLLIPLTSLPVFGVVPVVGALLMLSGIAWALINIHALPMLVDMTDASRNGTYTGLYYLFSTLAAIVSPIVNGGIIQLTGDNYNLIMLFGPISIAIACVLMLGVRRGEAAIQATPDAARSIQGLE
jgi:MFS family permease